MSDFLGGIREALRRVGAGPVPAAFGDQVAATCLQALGAESARIAAALAHPLPALVEREQERPRASHRR